MIQQARLLLQKYFGYNDFRPGQAAIIQSLLANKDTLAIMPTGSGKSVCYQIPALLLPGVTLVVSPLIALMKDQVDALTRLGIPATFINSSLTTAEVNERLNQVRQERFKLLYIAPERLETEAFRLAIQSLNLSLLAIDEAHCISQWGHDFRPSYRSIKPFIASLPKRPIIGTFTATATDAVKQDIVDLLALAVPDVYITGFDRANLSFTVIRGENKQKFLLDYISSNREHSGIIYAATRKEVDNLHEALNKKGFTVGKYHAGMSDDERIRNQEAFVFDDIRIMVATNAFGMGIDKSNVRYVLHYNMPKNMEAYYQEAGRAGRDGEPSECLLLFGPQDPLLQKFLIEQSVTDPERKLHEYQKLQNMVDYCHTPHCLRHFILMYFGETPPADDCNNCSNCSSDDEVLDITIESQKIFSCILRMKERFGTALIADVLKGSQNKKVRQLGFETLSTYGILADYTAQEIKDRINRLIATGYLHLTESEYPVVKLTAQALAVLKGQAALRQKVAKKPRKTAIENPLFELLRKVRKEIAEREQVPPYVIFADSTLKEMCEFLPADKATLRRVKGVGEAKLARYGEEFLQVIHQYATEHGISLQTTPLSATKPANSNDTPSHLITFDMFQSGLSLDQIARERGLKSVTLEEHLVRCTKEGLYVNWDRLIPAQYEPLILTKVNELGAEKLRPLKDALPPAVDYTMIKAVLCKHNLLL